MRQPLKFLLLSGVVALACACARAADVAGAADYPGIKRFEGSEIVFEKKADFDALKLALGKLVWNGAEAKILPYKSASVEGKRTTICYHLPEGVSVLEAFRNYENELKAQGYEVLFSGVGEEVETPGYNNTMASEIYKFTGTYSTPEEKAGWLIYTSDDSKSAYLAAKKAGAGGAGDTFVSVYVLANTQPGFFDMKEGQAFVRLDVCDVRPMEQRMVLVKAAEMKSAISLNGRVALYGIQFDFDKATVQPASQPTLEQIAKLLEDNGDLRVLVVGHTDNVGAFEYNRALSQRRAEAVVADLVAKGIAPERLFPVGVSFASPIATNATEDGRAKNRRVELVDMGAAKVH